MNAEISSNPSFAPEPVLRIKELKAEESRSVCGLYSEPKKIPEIIKELCKKYNLNGLYFRKFCINKYVHKKNKNTFYLENQCQCGEFSYCDICEDYWKWEWDHSYKDHDTTCILCNRMKKYYIAQAEFYALYSHLLSDNDDLNDFYVQRWNSSIFGGNTAVTFTDLRLVQETAKEVCVAENILPNK